MQLKLLDPLLLGAAYFLVKRRVTGGVLRVTALVALLGTARRLIAGLHARRVRRLAGESDLRILIVGAGFSGLAMALKCKQLGLSFTILDSGTDVGGTWRDNTYPGCGCDVVTPLYSLAGEQDFKFSGSWASASECLSYVKHIVEKHGLQQHIRQRCAVSQCEWDAAARRWTVAFTNEDGKDESLAAHIVVAGCGQLRDPVGPAFDCTAFEGPVVHTARWDPTVKLANKRVACIGTGASAIQFVPAVVDSVERMFVFQRSPPHTLFKVPSVPVVGSVAQVLRNNSVLVQRLFRFIWYYFMEGFFYIFVDQSALRSLGQRLVLSNMRRQITKPELQDVLIPTTAVMTKRVVVTNEWLPTMCRDDVEVVADPIARLTKTGVLMQSGREVPVDVVVQATGFDASKFVLPMQVVGENGKRLADVWGATPHAFYGLAVPGFPNFFHLYGPGTNLGHNSILTMVDTQVDYIGKIFEKLVCSAEAAAGPTHTVCVTDEAHEAYRAKARARLADTVWARAGQRTWYTTPDGGDVVNNWYGSCGEYKREMQTVHEGAWEYSV